MKKLDANALAVEYGSEELARRFREADSQESDPSPQNANDNEEGAPSGRRRRLRGDGDGQNFDVGSQPVTLDTIDLNDLAELELPPREYVLKPIIPVRGLAMVYAFRGVGKTMVAMGMAFAVSTGTSFLRWEAVLPRKVLYVDGEMPQEALQERVLMMTDAADIQPEDGYFRFLAMDRQELDMSLNLANPTHQALIEAQLGDTEFLVIDNLSTLVDAGPENDAESWVAMQKWILRLRRRGVSVLIVHHAGRAGNSRGTSKREDVLNTVMLLKHPEDYSPEDGARFEVHLTKARGLYGDDVRPFEAKLMMDGDAAVWTCADLDAGDEEEVLALSRDGKSVRAIAAALQMSKSGVQRIIAKAKEDGVYLQSLPDMDPAPF